MTTKLAAALTGVLFLICSHWYAYCAGGRNYTAALKLEYAHATKKADDAARKQERQFSDQLQKAQDDAKNRETKLLADATAARTESSRLHDTLADFQRKLPDLTEQAVRQYADAASVVFDQCQKQYLDMAETADRIDSDRQTLEDAWPK